MRERRQTTDQAEDVRMHWATGASAVMFTVLVREAILFTTFNVFKRSLILALLWSSHVVHVVDEPVLLETMCRPSWWRAPRPGVEALV
jgi:hypothetical protein